MKINIINTGLNLIGLGKQKNAAIYEGTKELFDNFLYSATIISVEVKEDSQVSRHPLEDGSLISDYKYNLPVEIMVTMVMPYYGSSSFIDELKGLFNEGREVTIRCKGGIYNNMVLKSMPHEETSAKVDRLLYKLSFVEAKKAASNNTNANKFSVAGFNSVVNYGEKKVGEILNRTVGDGVLNMVKKGW